ncbi:MAG: DUF1295 domain-containing protein [Lapillicoccus sp.]
MTFSFGNLLLVSGLSLVAVAVLMTVTGVIGARIGKVSVVDTTWGLGFIAVALVSALVGQGSGSRRLLLLALVAIWAGRLAWHIGRKNKGKPEDPRYAKMKEGKSTVAVILKVYGLQGVLIWFISLPLQVSAAAGAGVAWVVVLGGLVWLLGVVFEATGDAQLAAFKADSSNKGKVMDQGLWGWTRHPNYFGDSAVWWGLFTVAASAWPGVLTVLSPVVMTYFLVFGSGGTFLEREMSKRPGYPEYMARTSFFLPRPPKKA